MAEPSQSVRPDSDMLQGRINFKLDICPFPVVPSSLKRKINWIFNVYWSKTTFKLSIIKITSDLATFFGIGNHQDRSVEVILSRVVPWKSVVVRLLTSWEDKRWWCFVNPLCVVNAIGFLQFSQTINSNGQTVTVKRITKRPETKTVWVSVSTV